MGQTFSLGRISGIRIGVNWSVLVIVALLPRLNGGSDGRALVFADGRLAGIVAPADISRALEPISGNRGPFGSTGRGRRP